MKGISEAASMSVPIARRVCDVDRKAERLQASGAGQGADGKPTMHSGRAAAGKHKAAHAGMLHGWSRKAVPKTICTADRGAERQYTLRASTGHVHHSTLGSPVS